MSTPRIIAFTKDWHDVPTCTTHILREMGRTMPVLWVNSIGTRKPSLASGRDIGRVLMRLRRLFARAEWKENQLRVLSPLLMPKAESTLMRWLNRKLFAWYVRREREWMGDGPIEYWCFVPNAIDLVKHGLPRHSPTKPGAPSSERGAGSSESEVGGPERSTKPEERTSNIERPTSNIERRTTKNPRDAEAANAASEKNENPAGAFSRASRISRSGFLCSLQASPSRSLFPSVKESSRSATLVYYCVDDWSQFESLDTAWIAGKERALLQRADIVFATSCYLVDQCATSANTPVHYMPHGVDYEKFARARDARSAELGGPKHEERTSNIEHRTSNIERRTTKNDLPRRSPLDEAGSTTCHGEVLWTKPGARTASVTIGFYGNLCSWIDFALVAELAKARPDWHFVLIGPINADIAMLASRPNVELPGRVEHDDLPTWCARFDAAMIPYDMRHPRMKSVNPVKARELLAAGVPLVAARLPDLEGMEPDVLPAETVEQWLAALERQSRRTDRAEISARVAGQDWRAKVAEMRTILANRAM